MQQEPLDLFKKNNLKITTARKNILDLFGREHAILCSQDIFTLLKKSGIDLATVYRTLQTFEIAGIIKKVDTRKGVDHYELATQHHHHHLICKKCNSVESFEMCIALDVSKKILKSSKKFKSVDEHSFELFGYCNKCSRV
jgi:Fe2+ or Zn2+ uptake regulation protein